MHDLERAIVEQPEDTQLRLVFADWLEENGQLDRATFIREQCALADVPKWSPLWRTHWSKWVHRWPAKPALPPGVTFHAFAFERGFPSHVVVDDLRSFVEHAADIFAAAPIRAVEIKRGDVDQLLRVPHLARLRSLKFALSELDEAAIGKLDDCEALHFLHKLSFEFAGISGAGVRALVRSRFTTHVRKLGLASNFFVERGASLGALSGSRWPELRALNLAGNRLDGALLTRVLDAELPQLSALILAQNAIRAEIGALRDRALDRLDVSRNALGLAGLRVVLSGAASLRYLRASANKLGPAAAKPIIAASWNRLEHLDLEGNPLGDDARSEIVDALGLAPLHARANAFDRVAPRET